MVGLAEVDLSFSHIFWELQSWEKMTRFCTHPQLPLRADLPSKLGPSLHQTLPGPSFVICFFACLLTSQIKPSRRKKKAMSSNVLNTLQILGTVAVQRHEFYSLSIGCARLRRSGGSLLVMFYLRNDFHSWGALWNFFWRCRGLFVRPRCAPRRRLWLAAQPGLYEELEVLFAYVLTCLTYCFT